MVNFDLCENDVLKLVHGSCNSMLCNLFWLAHHPWNPEAISI